EADFRRARPTVVVGVPRLYEKILRGAREQARRKGQRAQVIFRLAERAAIRAGRRGPRRRPAGLTGWLWDALVYRRVRRVLGGRTRLLISGGAPLGRGELLFLNGAGLPTVEGYGLTETASVVTVGLPREWKAGSVGRALPGTEVRIGPEGEVLVRGHSVMRGYWNDEAGTNEALRDGWLHTGDLGRIDDDGFQLGELAFTLQCVNRPVGAEDMVYHGLVSATISAVPEMELYRFSGQIGDRVVLRVNRSSGELNPHLRLYRPDGGLVAEAGPVWPGNDRTELFDQSLLQTGQYTVYVSDDDGSQLGEFALTVECVNRPLGAKAVVYDDLLEDTLETAPRFRLYRFEGQIGDRAIFRVNRTSGEVNPCVRVYRPDGSLLAEAGPLWPNYERAELFDLNLSQTGTHTLLVADEDGYQLDQYHVTLQCVNRPVGTVTAGYDELVSGQVADVPEMYLFRFDGAVGEQVCIRLNRTSGDLNPWVRLYRPDGSLLAEAGPLWPGYERTELYDQLLSQTGTYTLYVSDEDGYQTGSYAMMLECINDPGEVYPAAYNDLIADTVDAVPRWHVYRFAGQSGDRLIVRANRISGEVNPWIRIYRPDGSLLADAGPMWPSYDRAELYDVTLNFSGTYTLYVSDEDGYQMGEYGVTLQCVNRPIGAGTMAFGDVAAEVIDSFPRIRLHRFLATVGDRVVIQASRVSGDVVSWVRLYDPSGNVVTEGQSDGAVTICAALIPATGQQTIYLSDDDGFGLGTDTLRLLEFKCGDVNTMSGPAAINVSDITYLIAWTFRGGPPPMCLQAADVTNDGGFTVADLTYLISYLFRGGPAPAC
ncbi:MAG TPA: AMP-binding protein, partial [candidate division Zixibacteria bacterium]|nr:AMP-binding protein [candidate division Zixibacteria bacterium]